MQPALAITTSSTIRRIASCTHRYAVGGLGETTAVPLGRAARPDAASSVAPVELRLRTLPASLPRNEHRTPATSDPPIPPARPCWASAAAPRRVPLSGSKKWNRPGSTASRSGCARPSPTLPGSTRALKTERGRRRAGRPRSSPPARSSSGLDARRIDREDHVRVGAEVLEHRHLTSSRGRAGSAKRRVVEGSRAGCRARPCPAPARRASGMPIAAELDRVVRDGRLDEVHRRRADERGHEEVRRLAVETLRRVDLLDAPVAHHRDALAERHRLDLVVRHVDRRRRRAARAGSTSCARMLTRSFASRFDSGSSIRNAFGSRTMARPIATRWRWPPESAAGRRSRSSSRPQHAARRSRRGARSPRFGGLANLEPVAEVLAHRHVRVERVVLEHHRDVAVVRRQRR